MISVSEAEKIVLAEVRDYGTELVPFEEVCGRVLAEDIVADRDLPACNRSTMDGIAILYAAFDEGVRKFVIVATLAAGDAPVEFERPGACVEIMTGAAAPECADAVVRYEDIEIVMGVAKLTTEHIKKGQNIHYKGRDKKAGDVIVAKDVVLNAAHVSIVASVGLVSVKVKKLPKVVVITTGDELVDANESVTPYQVRRSNNYGIKAVLQRYGLNVDMLHLRDEQGEIEGILAKCLLEYDVIILSGGVSMGKFDYVPKSLEKLGVDVLFHKVQQKPGKPFWFGKKDNALVFAFPGNPVSTFMCLHRYFVPWLEASLGLQAKKQYAVLAKDFRFDAPLQFFLQVALEVNDKGMLMATPLEGNGSGDFANLAGADAFMELPAEGCNFKEGEVYRVWPFKGVY